MTPGPTSSSGFHLRHPTRRHQVRGRWWLAGDVPRPHRGPGRRHLRYGMVNSEEGYQNLRRFLFGDLQVQVELVGLDVQGREDDDTIWQLETSLAIRGLPVLMHESFIDHLEQSEDLQDILVIDIAADNSSQSGPGRRATQLFRTQFGTGLSVPNTNSPIKPRRLLSFGSRRSPFLGSLTGSSVTTLRFRSPWYVTRFLRSSEPLRRRLCGMSRPPGQAAR